MTTFMWLAVSSIAWGAVLCIAALMLQKSGGVSGRMRQAIWRGAAVLLLAPWIAAPLVAMFGLGVAPGAAVTPAPELSQLPVSEGELLGAIVADVAAPVVSTGMQLPQIAWGEAVIIVLLAGWLVRFVLAQLSVRSLMGIVAKSEPAGAGPARQSIVAWAARLKLRRRPELRISEANVSPFSYGVLRPVICLPQGLDAKLRRDALDLVVGHECVHVARGDGWLRPLDRVCADILWFNPFAWVIRRELDLARELACDEALIELCASRRVYARTLRDVAGIAAGLPVSIPAASMSLPGSGRALVERVTRTLGGAQRKPARAMLIAAIALGLVGIPAALAQSVLAIPRVYAPEAPPAPPAPPSPPSPAAPEAPPSPPAAPAPPSPPSPASQPAAPSPPASPSAWPAPADLDGGPQINPAPMPSPMPRPTPVTPPTPPVAVTPVTPATPVTPTTLPTPVTPRTPTIMVPVAPLAPLQGGDRGVVVRTQLQQNVVPADKAKAPFRFDAVTSPVIEVPARLTMAFGYQTDPFDPQKTSFHEGIDLAAARDTPIHTPGDGVVTFSGPKGTYGRVVQVQLANGAVVRFGHLAELKVETGAEVKAGDTVGTMGSSGRSTGIHLHFELFWKGKSYDPETVEGLVLAPAS